MTSSKKIHKDLEIFQNTTKVYELIIKKLGMTIDITDWIIYFTVKKNMNDKDNDAKIKKDITDHADPTNGKTLIELTTSDTNLIGSHLYDIKYKDDSGNVGIICNGRIKFIKPVTTRE